MRVMMLAPGGSVHALRPLRWLVERGCKVLFVDGRKPDASGLDFAYATYPFNETRIRRLGWRLAYRIALAELRWRFSRWRADIVHVHWVDRRAHACVAAGLKPLVLTVWGSDINLVLGDTADPVDQRMVGESLAAADLVIVDSTDMPAKCADLAGRPVPTALLPLGIDTDRFCPPLPDRVAAWRERHGIPADATTFMSVRAWGPRYGHADILEAFAEARRSSNRPMVLVFKVYNAADYPAAAGLQAQLQRRADHLGIGADLRWIGQVPHEELALMYGVADVVLNYPEIDAFPVTFLEAAACQCPVITNDLPAYTGTFVHDYFRVVPPGDRAALADAIREAAAGDRIANRASLAGARALVAHEFDERVTADRLVALYRQVQQTSR